MRPSSRRRPQALSCAALCALALSLAIGARADDDAARLLAPGDGLTPGLGLKLQRSLLQQWKQSKDERPAFLMADRLEGRAGEETTATGNAELRRATQVLNADWLKYWSDDDTVFARGNVRLTRINGDAITGPEMKLKLDANTGYFDKPEYSFGQYTAHGSADRIVFDGENRYRLENGTFTTCPAGQEDWILRTRDIELDYTRDVGVARGATVSFMGVPVLSTPWVDFPLTSRRKTGFLSPTFGTTGKSGAEVTTPFYWNIAPNMDATIAPRVMTKRGVQLNSEFRYLDENYHGEARVEWLPSDRLKGTDRFGLALEHSQNFGNGFSGGLNLNKVSDDSYFTDLATRIAMTSQANLLRDGYLKYYGGWWSGIARIQSFQTLQDPAAPIDPPYHRTPQLLVSALRPAAGGDFSFLGEFVDFSHPTKVTGSRLSLYPSFSLPLDTAAAYVTPKFGVRFVEYGLHNTANNPVAGDNTFSRTVPVFSVDSGVTFERDMALSGNKLVQTLEPRLYYLHVPYRDQSAFPIFDTALADLNLMQLFSENTFVGGDRIADANQLTAAVSSRLIQADNGQERVRVTVGQRFYFEQQKVTLDNTTPARPAGASDFIAAITGKLTDHISLDTSLQYNLQEKRTERSGVSLRYYPELGKVLNAGFRYQRDVLQQVDVSAQWPVWGNVSLVGRYNYSIRDRRVLEEIGGVEYNGGCWVARLVMQRYALSTLSSTTAVFVQLELNGLSKIGSNPLESLKRNIPGYSRINQPIAADSGFSLYE